MYLLSKIEIRFSYISIRRGILILFNKFSIKTKITSFILFKKNDNFTKKKFRFLIYTVFLYIIYKKKKQI